jgi:hypothetical protein
MMLRMCWASMCKVMINFLNNILRNNKKLIRDYLQNYKVIKEINKNKNWSISDFTKNDSIYNVIFRIYKSLLA